MNAEPRMLGHGPMIYAAMAAVLKECPAIGKKITVDSAGCWLWTGATIWNGYGQAWIAGRHVAAHRAVYELVVAPIPPGLVLDHLCRVRNCVNPEHLEPVTQGENCRRGNTGKHLADRTACPRGHVYDYVSPQGERGCRTCRNDASRRSKQRKASRG